MVPCKHPNPCPCFGLSLGFSCNVKVHTCITNLINSIINLHVVVKSFSYFRDCGCNPTLDWKFLLAIFQPIFWLFVVLYIKWFCHSALPFFFSFFAFASLICFAAFFSTTFCCKIFKYFLDVGWKHIKPLKKGFCPPESIKLKACSMLQSGPPPGLQRCCKLVPLFKAQIWFLRFLAWWWPEYDDHISFDNFSSQAKFTPQPLKPQVLYVKTLEEHSFRSEFCTMNLLADELELEGEAQSPCRLVATWDTGWSGEVETWDTSSFPLKLVEGVSDIDLYQEFISKLWVWRSDLASLHFCSQHIRTCNSHPFWNILFLACLLSLLYEHAIPQIWHACWPAPNRWTGW